MQEGSNKIMKLLVEAHSNEAALVGVLDSHSRVAPPGEYRHLLQRHLQETKRHTELLGRRLETLGHTRSPLAIGYGLVQNAVKGTLVLAKAPVDMLRGGTDRSEKMIKNAMDEAMTEGMEIAAYDVLETVARNLGDHETAELAAEIRLDEERMLEDLRKEIPVLAESFAAPESDAAPAEPWAGYDDGTAAEINKKVRAGGPVLARSVADYESRNKSRQTVLHAAEETMS